MLEYKADTTGSKIVVADRWFPSGKASSSCGAKLDEMPLNIREWTCDSCGTHHDRDINAAINLRNYAFSTHKFTKRRELHGASLWRVLALATL